jgi:hypothetical protein
MQRTFLLVHASRWKPFMAKAFVESVRKALMRQNMQRQNASRI